jgi:hypothetical protein
LAGSSGWARRPAGGCACASPWGRAPARRTAAPACRVLGVAVEVACRGEFDDAAEIHHRDAVGDVFHHREIVATNR